MIHDSLIHNNIEYFSKSFDTIHEEDEDMEEYEEITLAEEIETETTRLKEEVNIKSIFSKNAN